MTTPVLSERSGGFYGLDPLEVGIARTMYDHSNGTSSLSEFLPDPFALPGGDWGRPEPLPYPWPDDLTDDDDDGVAEVTKELQTAFFFDWDGDGRQEFLRGVSDLRAYRIGPNGDLADDDYVSTGLSIGGVTSAGAETRDLVPVAVQDDTDPDLEIWAEIGDGPERGDIQVFDRPGSSGRPMTLVRVEDGAGASILVQYQDAGHLHFVENTECPTSASQALVGDRVERCLVSGGNFVKQVDEDYGENGLHQSVYQYRDGRYDSASGRFLGFERVIERIDRGQIGYLYSSVVHITGYESASEDLAPSVPESASAALAASLPYLVDYELTLVLDDVTAANGAADSASLVDNTWDRAASGSRIYLREQKQAVYEMAPGATLVQAFRADDPSIEVVAGISPSYRTDSYIDHIDEYGNVLESRATTGGLTTWTTREFAPRIGPALAESADSPQNGPAYELSSTPGWLPRRLRSETVTYADAETVTTEFAYYDDNAFPAHCTQLAGEDKACNEIADASRLADTGVLKSVTIDPNTHDWRSKEIAYDLFGNIVATTSESGDTGKVQEHVEFDNERHLFPVKGHNPLGQRGQVVWNGELGVPTLSTGIAGRQQSMTYDGLGRQLSVQVLSYEGKPSAELTTSEYQRVTPLSYGADGLPSPSATRIRSMQASGPWSEQTYGPGGQPTNERWIAASGDIAKRTFEYGTWGQLEWVSNPHLEGHPGLGWSMLHDASGRVLETISPTGNRTRNEYSRREHFAFDAEHSTPWRYTFNEHGRIESVVDPAATRFCYSYDARSNLDIVTKDCDPGTGAGVETADFDYDVRGRLVRFQDEAGGELSYGYDALGRLSSTVNGAAEVTAFDYDALDRITSRLTEDGATTYHYDSLGVLAPPTGYTGTAEPGALLATFSTISGAESWYAYDDYGQMRQSVDVIDGHELIHEFRYDDYLRPSTVSYPTVGAATLLELEYEYDAAGSLSAVSDVDRRKELWSATQRDASGRLTRFDVGPDTTELVYDDEGRLESKVTARGIQTLLSQEYAYTPNGNLDWRRNNASGVTESFEYDLLDRLTSSSLTGETWSYDKFGNKSDVATTISGQMIDAPGVDVDYDDAGRLKTYDDGDRTLDIDWNVDGQPAIIAGSEPCCGEMSPQNAGHETLEFTYGASGELVRRIAEYSGDDFVRRDSIYAGSYELVDDANGGLGESSDRTEKVRVPLPGGSIVVVAASEASDGDATYLYSHPDLLGSVEVVTEQNISESGKTTWPETSTADSRSYGPWGQPRAFDWGSTAATFGQVNEGYTGHRAQRDAGMIDMNLRHYDPATRQFVSPDPVVGNVYDTQDWNRYAYVRNNPTSFTDPTGALYEGLVDRAGGSGGQTAGWPAGFGGGYGSQPLSREDWKRAWDKVRGAFTPPRNEAKKPRPPAVVEHPSPFSDLEPSLLDHQAGVAVDEGGTVIDVQAKGNAAVEAVLGPGQLGTGDRWRMTRRFEFPRVPRPTSAVFRMARRFNTNPVFHYDSVANFGIGVVEGVFNIPADAEDLEVQKQRMLEDFQAGNYSGAAGHGWNAVGIGFELAMNIASVMPLAGMVGRVVNGGVATAGRGMKALLPGLKIGEKQFGKKVGKHAEDFGLDASNPVHRTEVRERIEGVVARYDEVRQGPWNPKGGGGSDFLFFRKGSDIVITKPTGDFVTVLPGVTRNGWFEAARSLF